MNDQGEPGRASTVEGLADDLRRLRLDAGNPTLLRLQESSGVSKSVLSEAFKGKQLPSERTLDSVVRALGGDSAAWLARRTLVASPAAQAELESDVRASSPPRLRERTLTLRTGVLLVIVAFGAGVGSTLLVTAPRGELAGAASHTGAIPSGGSSVSVTAGSDPAATPCVEDAVKAAAETRNADYLLEIIWSEKCEAAWGRITRYDNQSNGNSVRVEIAPQNEDAARQRQESYVADVQSAYTPLVLRPNGDTRICASGSVTLNGVTVDLGDPLCT